MAENSHPHENNDSKFKENRGKHNNCVGDDGRPCPVHTGIIYVALAEDSILLKEKQILEWMFNNDPWLTEQMKYHYSIARKNPIALLDHYRVFQNISEIYLKQLLDHIFQQKVGLTLHSALIVLGQCCSSVAVVKRVMDYPATIPFFKNIIQENLEKVLRSPLKGIDASYLCGVLAFCLGFIGRFIAFPKRAKDILTWWSTEFVSLRDKVLSTLEKTTLNTDDIAVVCESYLTLETVINNMANLPDPDIRATQALRIYNLGKNYVVFCSSLRCSVAVQKNSVLPHCSRCMLARYCSRQCQRYHWKNGHRETCWKLNGT